MTANWDDLPLQLTVPEVAEILRVDRNHVYKLIRQHAIPHIRLGRLVRIPRDELRYWQHSHSPRSPHSQTAVAARTSRPKVDTNSMRGGLKPTGTHGRR